MSLRRTIHRISHGALAPVLIAGLARSAAAQADGPPRTRFDCEGCPQDSVVLRMIAGKDRLILLRLDTLMRKFGDEPFGSAQRVQLEREIKSAMDALSGASDARRGFELMPRALMRASFANVAPHGWIGLNLEGPHELSMRPDGLYIRYFDYPEVLSVEPNSPAERAGLQRGDMVMAYDGSDLRQNRINITRMFVPQKRISVEVRRDGEPHGYTVVVGRAPDAFASRRMEFNYTPTSGAEPPELRASLVPTPLPPGAIVIPPNGVFGAAVSTVNVDLAKALGLSRGVLVTEAPVGTPAAHAGLRPGDVIIRVEGRPVSNVPELRAAVMGGVRNDAVTLEVMRGKKARKITISW